MGAYKETDSYKEFQKKKKALKAKKALKKMKDPNKPKRAPSAYFLFMADVRADLKQEMPEASIGEIGKKLGQMWAELAEEKKTAYQEKSAELKKEADAALKAYKESDSFKAHQAQVKEMKATVAPKKVKVAKKK